MASKITLTATHTGGERMLTDTHDHPQTRPSEADVAAYAARLRQRWALVALDTSTPDIAVEIQKVKKVRGA